MSLKFASFLTTQASVPASLSNAPTLAAATLTNGQSTIIPINSLFPKFVSATPNPAFSTKAASSTPFSLTISVGSNVSTQCPPPVDEAVFFVDCQLACYDEVLIGWDPADKSLLVIYVYRLNALSGRDDWKVRVCTLYAGQELDRAIYSCRISYRCLFDMSEEFQGPLREYVKEYMERLIREGHALPSTTYVAPRPPIPTFSGPDYHQPSQWELDWRDFWEHGGKIAIAILAPMTVLGGFLGSVGFFYVRRMGGIRAAWVDLQRRAGELGASVPDVRRRLVSGRGRGSSQVPQAGVELGSLRPATSDSTREGPAT